MRVMRVFICLEIKLIRTNDDDDDVTYVTCEVAFMKFAFFRKSLILFIKFYQSVI